MIVQILRTSMRCRWIASRLSKSMLFLFQRTHESVNTATDGYEDNSISSSSPGKRQLDPNDSDEATWRKTRIVRSFNTTNVHGDADYESEDSDNDMVDDDSRATPSFNGRRAWLTNGKTSTISSNHSGNAITCWKICIFNTANMREDSCNHCQLPFNTIRNSERIPRWSEEDNSWLATTACK